MSDFKPMNECKGFNMERVLLKNKNGYMITAYFKDGMLQCDGDEDWTRPAVWDSFIRLRDLANGADSKPANCAIFDVSKMLPEDICKVHGHVMYPVYKLDNTANAHTSHFGLNKCSRCGYEDYWQYDM